MEQQIERTLESRANFALAGISFTDTNLYVKAFRLKHFYRCPRCDQPRLLTWNDGLTQMFRCSNCGAEATSREILGEDEIILDLVKQMTGQSDDKNQKRD